MDKENKVKCPKHETGGGPCYCDSVCASFSNELLCSMPKELTAENGAKGLLSGEFYETIKVDCLAFGDICHDENCEDCKGTGSMEQRIPIQWTTIKEIYAMAVKHLGT